MRKLSYDAKSWIFAGVFVLTLPVTAWALGAWFKYVSLLMGLCPRC